MPVQTALCNCTRDEGGPFEFGNQVLISSHRKPLSSKAMVVNVAETWGHDLSRHGRERRAQANRCRSVESGLVAMGGWRTRRHETAPIDSAALFGLSFWVDRASTTCAADGRVLSSLCAPTLAPSKEFGSVWPSPRLRTAQESRLSKSAINVNRRATWP